MTAKWTHWHTFAILVIVLAVFLVGLLVPNNARLWGWLGTLILLIVFIAVASHGITGLWRGWLIDERNKISLSRLQMTLWTVIVLSGYYTAALANLAARQAGPLSIAIPGELWLLMGISTTSLVASPLIKSNKKLKQAKQDEKASTLALMARQGTDTGKVESKGLIVVNKTLEDAQWSDLFKGEETGNAALLDLAKIQMFYFTLILALAYAVALGSTLVSNTARISEFPALDPGIVALLGISHAGYLTNKAIPHSETQ